MIPHANITAWRATAPWGDEAQVEQDLILSRAIVALFSDRRIAGTFAMRGGTALNKLTLARAMRYSEDIDLVQVIAGPVRPFFDALREQIDPWLGAHAYDQREHSVRAIWRFETETTPMRRMRLKIEANTREHLTLHGVRPVPFRVENPWFRGEAAVPTFEVEELLGTKLRALYQRKKGRDLFDLYTIGRRDGVRLDRVAVAFTFYLSQQGLAVRKAEMEANLLAKLKDRAFRADIGPLLAPDAQHDVDEAGAWVLEKLLPHLD